MSECTVYVEGKFYACNWTSEGSNPSEGREGMLPGDIVGVEFYAVSLGNSLEVLKTRSKGGWVLLYSESIDKGAKPAFFALFERRRPTSGRAGSSVPELRSEMIEAFRASGNPVNESDFWIRAVKRTSGSVGGFWSVLTDAVQSTVEAITPENPSDTLLQLLRILQYLLLIIITVAIIYVGYLGYRMVS